MTGTASIPPEPWTEVALGKLTRILGPEKAKTLTAETLHRIGLTELRSPNDLRLFAEELMKRGGFIEAVGRALHIHALLRGATEE